MKARSRMGTAAGHIRTKWMRTRIHFTPNERGWNLIFAVMIGATGALVALGYASLTDLMRSTLTGGTPETVSFFDHLVWWQRLLIPVAGGVVAGLVLTFGLRAFRGRGSEYMEAVAIGDGKIPVRPSLVRSLSGIFTIASGESIGREGPMVQLSALSASMFARFSRLSPVRIRLIVGCGAAAGWTVAYNAPVGGALFVSEVLLHSIAMESFGPILVSAVTADIVKYAIGNPEPIYHVAKFTMGAPDELLLYVVLGLVAGIGSGLYLGLLQLGKSLFDYFRLPLFMNMGLGGLVVGMLAVYHPEITGNGYGTILLILQDRWLWQMVLLTMVLKIVATSAVFGSGAVGGVFTPTLMVGASLGFVFESLAASVWTPSPLQAVGYTMVGMGAFLAAVTQAPVMAIFIVFEMTYSPAILLPLTLSALTSYYVARSLGYSSIYRQSLSQRQWPLVFDQPLHALRVKDIMEVPEYVLHEDTPFVDVVDLFLVGHHSMMHVLDRHDKYLGTILRSQIEDNLKYENVFGQLLAGDVFREHVPVLRRDVLLMDAMKTFVQSACDQLPVVEKGSRRLVGILSRNDLFLTISEVTQRQTGPL